MKPTWEDFGSFCHNMHCTSSHRNRNIADILEEIESKDRKLLELSKQGTASDIRQQIEETGQDKALLDKLLKQYYDVRGHRTVGNILRDPMECVTVDGVGSLPLTGKYWRQGTDSSCRERQKQPVPCLCMDKRGFHPDRIFYDPPANKQVFKVKTVIEKALNKKQDVKKKRNTHPKL